MIYSKTTKLGGTQYYYKAINSKTFTKMSRCSDIIANISHGHELPEDVVEVVEVSKSLSDTCKFLDGYKEEDFL